MPPRSQRAAAALLLVLSLVLTGCGTGFKAQTNRVYTAGVGSNHREGEVDVLNALFVDNADGTATFSAGFINNLEAADALTAVSVTATTGGKAVPSKLTGRVMLPSQRLYSSGPKADVLLTGAGFAPGDFLTVALTFENAAPVSISVPVVTRSSTYASVATGPSASGVATTAPPDTSAS